MLIKIDFRPEDIVEQGENYLILKPRFFTAFAQIFHIAVFKNAQVVKELESAKVSRSKLGFVGQNGGISLEN